MADLIANDTNRISNRFSNGEYTDFNSAMAAIRSAYLAEKRTDDEVGAAFWGEQIAEVDKAQEIYERHMQGVKEKIAAELRDQNLEQFAEALESDDCSGFAY